VLYFRDFFSELGRKDNPEPSHLVYTTQSGVQVLVKKGRKPQSPYDFRVRFREPGKRERQQAHVHSIVEMYVKHAFNPELTLKLRDHILEVFDMIQSIDYYPPRLQVFKPEHVEPFKELDKVGEFTVEFMLVTTELIMIQEKTNYPQGSLTKQLYADFGVKNRFSVIQAATFRGQRG
jgi:hypothetical protein